MWLDIFIGLSAVAGLGRNTDNPARIQRDVNPVGFNRRRDELVRRIAFIRFVADLDARVKRTLAAHLWDAESVGAD